MLTVNNTITIKNIFDGIVFIYNWNRDAMDEVKVAADVEEYTEGKVSVPEDMRYVSVSNGHLPGSKASKKRKRRNM